MLYLVVYILNLCDFAITHLAVNVWQVSGEANLLMVPAVDNLWLFALIKVGLMGFVMWQLWYLWHRRRVKVARIGGIVLLLLYSFVVAGNCWAVSTII
jgi:hypothetical protein